MTATALVLAPLACGAALLVSGAAKLGDRAGTRAAFKALEVPRALRVPWVIRGLPYAELVLGLALVLTWGWALALTGVLSVALFAAYWVLVARVVRRGREAHCNCFGNLGDDRVTWRTLARNSVLVVLALLVVVFGAQGSGVPPALRDFRGADWLWLAMAALVALGAALLMARPPGRAEATDVAEGQVLDYVRQPIPFGMLEAEDGTRRTLRQLAAERPQLLVLLSVGCGSCHDVAAGLVRWVDRLAPVEVDLVFTQPLAELPEDLRPAGIRRWLDLENGVTETFGWARPSAVLLGADGMLAGGPVGGFGAVMEFVEDIVAELQDAKIEDPVIPSAVADAS